MSLKNDEKYMELALLSAAKGNGWTNPNPLVGCVIVKNNTVISTGYHHQFGGWHAEVDAINKLSDDEVSGSTIYVTLEPCSHHGKTGPCVDLIIQKHVKRVVIGILDPNPLVDSVKKMRDHGIEVTVGVLEEECFMMNRIFFWYITHHRPFVCLKIAMSIDGKIATKTGESKYITGPESREDSFWLRQRYAAIMVSAKTVNHDQAMLNIRIDDDQFKWHHPIKVILDRTLRIEMAQPILRTMIQAPIIIFTSHQQRGNPKIYELNELGVLVYFVDEIGDELNLKQVIDKLGSLQIDSLIIEAGPNLAAGVMKAGIANILRTYIGSSIIGGQSAPSAFADLGIEKIADRKQLSLIAMKNLGDEIVCEYNISGGSWEDNVLGINQINYKN